MSAVWTPPPPPFENGSNDPAIRFLGDLERLELKPGDQFVLTVPIFLTKGQRDYILRAWKDFVGDNAEELKLLILEGGMKLGAISIAGAPLP